MKNDLAVQLNFITRDIDRRIEGRMHDRHVITFEIILDIGFPVTEDFVADALHRTETLERHVSGVLL